MTHKQLEAGLEPGERAAVVRVGRVALDDRSRTTAARRSRRHRPSAPAPTDPISPPCNAQPAATTAVASSAEMRMRSSDTTRRSRGAINAPISAPATLATSTAPKCHVGAVAGWPVPTSGKPAACRTARPIDSPTGTGASLPPPFRSNASRKVRKPTMPRSSPIASAACTMPAPRSSTSSACVGRCRRDRLRPTAGWPAREAVADVIAAHTSAASGPRNFTMSAAGAADDEARRCPR